MALMRSLPNMTVVEVADATEIETLLDAIEDVPGPVYVRMLRGEVPRLFDAAAPLRLGRLRTVANDNPGGQVDLTIFSVRHLHGRGDAGDAGPAVARCRRPPPACRRAQTV